MPDPVVVAGRNLGREIRSARIVARSEVAYDPYLAGRAVERVTGVAELIDGDSVEWTAIVKRTTGAGLRAARRELSAYRDGVTSGTPVRRDAADRTTSARDGVGRGRGVAHARGEQAASARAADEAGLRAVSAREVDGTGLRAASGRAVDGTGLRAPGLLAWYETADHVEVWLEELTDDHGGVWPVQRYGVAARHIAAWDARAGKVGLPAGFDSEDAWAERHGQPHRLDEALAELSALRENPAAEEIMALMGDSGFSRTEALIATTPERIAALARFPQTLLHHDLVRSNLFAVTDSVTAAIDWENVGRGPLGVDLAPLVIGSIRRGEASVDELPEIERVVLDGYQQGLADAGIPAGDVRTAYRLAVGLRWHVVLGTIRAWVDPATAGIRGSRPDESRDESLRHLAALSRHIVDLGNQLTD